MRHDPGSDQMLVLARVCRPVQSCREDTVLIPVGILAAQVEKILAVRQELRPAMGQRAVPKSGDWCWGASGRRYLDSGLRLSALKTISPSRFQVPPRLRPHHTRSAQRLLIFPPS